MRARHHTVTVNHKKIVAVADPHLESAPDDVAQMIRFVESLNPADHLLVFLGDVFQVWTGSHRYHSSKQKDLMNALRDFRAGGGAVFLTVGNRDLFFRDAVAGPGENGLPFDVVSRDFIRLDMGNGSIMAHHGDTVNRDDKAYLRWRRVIRSVVAENAFNLIAVAKGEKIIAALEKKIKRTNQRFRIRFPHDNWSRFVSDQGRRYAPDLLLVGHFHPERPIINRQGDTTGIVVPAWHPSGAYLVIDHQLGYQVRQFDRQP